MTRARDIASGLGPEAGEGKPHIIPGVLYPAVLDKMLDGATTLSASTTGPGGSTVTSSKYGTVQSDGRMYYYTDIKGSKPIRDPRIGAHFGSQRHKFKSTQLLEQETATHGSNVYSVDGREWCRANLLSQGNAFNDLMGNYFSLWRSTAGYFEVVGYFIDINIILRTNSSALSFKHNIDGGSYTTKSSIISVESPLGSRFVDSGSVYNLGLSESLGIHTLRLENVAAQDVELFGIELIAQDTTSDANKLKIQIPSQNVVSYGKKFTVSGTPHYDPFTTMSYGGSGTTLSALQSLIDTDTSLGMDAWKAGTSNYHRPWNGGRIIKWVDSSGTIKTSVNMMPPNAQNIGTTASNAVSDAHVIAGTNDDTINFNTSAIDHTQAEVAKTFHVKEFGNGSANGNATYADASMLNSSDDIAYVMDDGLTGLSGTNGGTSNNSGLNGIVHYDSDYAYFTFIGTGVSITGVNWSGTAVYNLAIAQNLPYGTHIYKMDRNTSSTTKHFVDGVELSSVSQGSGHMISEITFHQPKKPPIPEDACVIADYMLMADHVIQGSAGAGYISKGVRSVDASRDALYDQSGAFSDQARFVTNVATGLTITWASPGDATSKTELPAFCTNQVHVGYNINQRYQTYAIDSGSGYSNVTPTAKTGTGIGSFYNNTGNAHALGLAKHKTHGAFAASSGWSDRIDVVTPIHTSFHYQPFETPFLYELVGGDRNMEQTNLVVSPDGKTWDEVTRDTSYIGNIRLHASDDGQNSNPIILTDFRGVHQTNGNYYQKNFAIAYDRFICLKSGQYEIKFTTYNNTTSAHVIIINGSNFQSTAMGNTSYTVSNATTADAVIYLKRGDYVQIGGKWWNQEASHFSITEV